MNYQPIRRTLHLTIAGVALIGITSCSSDTSTTTADNTILEQSATIETDAPAVTEPAPATTAAQVPEETVAPAAAPAETSELAPTPAEPATSAAPAADKLMPDVVCENLQDAQNIIQNHGVFLSLSNDATGQGRNQIIDSNWIVIAQSPAVGTPIDEGTPMLSAVKLDEPHNC